jgi:hypothetical protein
VLDEVLAGETIAIERKGQRVVLRLEEEVTGMEKEALPDYGAMLYAPDLETADAWGWDWNPDTGDAEPGDNGRS